MACNVGKSDRIIRVIIGIVLLVWGIAHWNGMNAYVIADILGVVMIFTAAIGWCGLYTLFGINSGCHIKKD